MSPLPTIRPQPRFARRGITAALGTALLIALGGCGRVKITYR